MDDEAIKQQANDLFHFLTWRSPLRQKTVRRAVSLMAGVMRASGDPGVSALGIVAEALVDEFEKRSKGGKKK